jgi:hypothetical protein
MLKTNNPTTLSPITSTAAGKPANADAANKPFDLYQGTSCRLAEIT